jgi:hypothetical protein
VATEIGWRHECFYVALVSAKECSSQSVSYTYREKCWTAFLTESKHRNANVAGPFLVATPSLVDLSFPVCRFTFLYLVPWHTDALAGFPVLLLGCQRSFTSFFCSVLRQVHSLFRSEFSAHCGLVLTLPIAAYVFFLVFCHRT